MQDGESGLRALIPFFFHFGDKSDKSEEGEKVCVDSAFHFIPSFPLMQISLKLCHFPPPNSESCVNWEEKFTLLDSVQLSAQ
jgi:hypothetical protein